MAADIELKIYMPERLALSTKAYRIFLPSDDKPLTVIKGRAPTLMALDMGSVRLLNENNGVEEEWLISGGAADIHDDTCTILTESALARKELTVEKAEALYADFPNPFYKWLCDYLKTEKPGR